MKNWEFIKAVEKMVDPIESGAMHVIQKYNEALPVGIQHKLIKASAEKNPYMGFIVDPYAFFTCFKITDVEYFQSLVDAKFKLLKASVFTGDEPEYYLIISSFNVRTSAFFGNRIEAYVIAEDTTTGMLTWVIVDILSNTISYEQRLGLVPANAKTIITTGFDGNVGVKASREECSFEFIATSHGTVRKLDPRLWIEGNLSVAYGTKLSASNATFSLLFDVGEVESAIEVANVELISNSWFGHGIESVPSINVVFPYAQHFISASPGNDQIIRNQAEMEQVISAIDFDSLTVYSSAGMFKIQQYLMLAMFIAIVLLIIVIVI